MYFTPTLHNDILSIKEQLDLQAVFIKFSNLTNPITLEGFTVRNGNANGGGGIHVNSSTVELKNLLVCENSAAMGGGVFIVNSNALLQNLTITDNTATLFGSGVYSPTTNESSYIVNSIIYGNNGDDEILNNPNVYYSLTSDLWEGEGNIIGDPLFDVNSFLLNEDSPCIDAGICEFTLPDPFNINIDQFNGYSIDMGCFEYIQTASESDLIQARTEINVYPNPFNPVLTISYSIGENDNLDEISIYNLKGQKIKDLDLPEQDCRHGSVIWDGVDSKGQFVSSGIYFCKFKSKQQSQLKKITLIK